MTTGFHCTLRRSASAAAKARRMNRCAVSAAAVVVDQSWRLHPAPGRRLGREGGSRTSETDPKPVVMER